MADQDEFIMLRNVRVSFPHLFKKPMIRTKDGMQEGKYGALLMLEKTDDKAVIAKISARIQAIVSDNFDLELEPGKLCLRDGKYKGLSEYMTLSANTDTQPFVIAADGESQIISAATSKIYAGCRVNAKVRLWPQDNQYGKRINAQLVAIQFAADDEPLTSSRGSEADALKGFGAVEAYDDAFAA